jgi:hypothetical protein
LVIQDASRSFLDRQDGQVMDSEGIMWSRATRFVRSKAAGYRGDNIKVTEHRYKMASFGSAPGISMTPWP